MHAQSTWGFNRFEISKIQWKATAVPKLTYANAVTVISSTTSNILEKAQRDAGRWSLGISKYKVANEFIDGELGWSTFEAREAQSKMRYLARIQSMKDTRWPKAILNMMNMLNLKTNMVTRTEYLQNIFDCPNIALEYTEGGLPLLNRHFMKIKSRVKDQQEEKWQSDMRQKSSLEMYRMGKNPWNQKLHLR